MIGLALYKRTCVTDYDLEPVPPDHSIRNGRTLRLLTVRLRLSSQIISGDEKIEAMGSRNYPPRQVVRVVPRLCKRESRTSRSANLTVHRKLIIL
jgi:hypothetical protein